MSSEPAKRSRGGVILVVAFLMMAAIAAAVYLGIASRKADRAKLEEAVELASIPTVTLVSPKPGAEAEEIALPGNVMAFVDTAIYARSSGYVEKWYFDIGSHVKSGDLLAEIESPEVDQQLEQSKADAAKAEADLTQAEVKAKRWAQLLKDRAVSSEESDEAAADVAAKRATLESRRASLRRLEKMQEFEKVIAPFAGVITARNVDKGDLVDGSGPQPRELFHLASLDKVRVFVSVPDVYAEAAREGGDPTLTLDQFPGRVFHGHIARNANAIDLVTRTLKVEVDVDNKDGALLAGAYAIVHLKVGRAHAGDTPSVTIPANTLLFRAEGPRVALFKKDHAELMPVKIGRDYGKTLEILSGLKPSDQLIMDPSDSLVTGSPVRAGKTVGEDKKK